jgi:hypothetical protein
VDLRTPHKIQPPSVASVVATIALLLTLVGVYSVESMPTALCWVGVIVAAAVVVGYIATMGTRNPYSTRRSK